MNKLLELYGLNSINEWRDEHRFDADLLQSIRINASYFKDKKATKEDALTLFEMILARKGGEERTGFSFYNILNDLLNSVEYQAQAFSYLLERLKMGKGPAKIRIANQWLHLELRALPSRDQGIFSCEIQVIDDGLAAIFPSNVAKEVVSSRFAPLIAIIESFLENYYNKKKIGKSITLFFGDQPMRDKGLAFCSRKNDYLIPDADFIASRGYEYARNSDIPSWHERKSLAYFRGTDTGCADYSSIYNCQRVKLALISNQFRNLIDAAITGAQGNNQELFAQYKKMGIDGAREPQEKIFEFKYQIDVDGNSNAWSSLFIKLLSGGVVLKIESPERFKQWYYNKLEPWINYVPIKADLSDLIEKIEYLQLHDEHAKQIAKQGRNLALSIDYKSSIDYAALVFNNAFMGL